VLASLRTPILLGLVLGLFACSPEAADTPSIVHVPDPQAPEPVRPVSGMVPHKRDYQFTTDWFSVRTPMWDALLAPYVDQPEVRYLEVGLWEGRSLLWMLDHVLTHPTSRASGIDIVLYDALRQNLARSGAAERVTLFRGPSERELRKFDPQSFDIIYIDGSHAAPDVLADLVLAWPLLKRGGLMILDDYTWEGAVNEGGSKYPPELRPRIAIDGFISAYRSLVEVVYKQYQVVLRRRFLGCPRGPWKCSSLGAYSYDWHQRALYKDGAEVALTDHEPDLVEALIRSKQGDALTLGLPPALLASPELIELSTRLDLGLH
jgi:predicted O-methyltransferase YrrM